MKRREFITLLGGAAAWPLAGQAQQRERMRRVGVFMNLPADDSRAQARVGSFQQGLQQLGWVIDRNVSIDYRWGLGDADQNRRFASDLVAVNPDVILAVGGSIDSLRQSTRTIPIVFVSVIDPVGRGIVANLARPGGNATGFISVEFSLSGKLLELLKQIAPDVKLVAVIRDTTVGAAGVGQFGAIQVIAPSLGVEVRTVDARDADEIERSVAVFARTPKSGLVIPASASAARHHDLIVAIAARYKLPAVYINRSFVAAGGLISYGPDLIDSYRQAAGYVDRILKGEKPADLPVQAPTKYELVINLNTAKARRQRAPCHDQAAIRGLRE